MGAFGITLLDGRQVSLRATHQHRTYAGLLEGWPTEELNAAVVQEDVAGAARCMHVSYPAVLIPPQFESWCESGLRDGMEPGTRRLLPAITTCAVFESDATARGEGCASAALFIWYQREWGLPSPAIIEALRHIDWGRFAVDFDY
jgi:hypothetical protein